jgi:Protein of unknown function (DUF2905)
MGKTLVVIGVLIALAGVLIMLGVPLGRLPGDISYRRGNTSFYFPLTTSILVSVVLTLLFALLRR